MTRKTNKTKYKNLEKLVLLGFILLFAIFFACLWHYGLGRTWGWSFAAGFCASTMLLFCGLVCDDTKESKKMAIEITTLSKRDEERVKKWFENHLTEKHAEFR